MKSESAVTLSIAAAAALALLFAPVGQAQQQAAKMMNSPTAQNKAAQIKNDPPPGMREAMMMVPAQAAVVRTIDARKAHPGQQFQAELADTVQLKNGPELPRGTRLIGTIAADRIEQGGASTLSLRFTKAQLKDGKIVPIKATIIAVYAPGIAGYDQYPETPGNQEPNAWQGHSLNFDQTGGLSGVDLHSRIADRDSGALVTTRKDDIKLPTGSELALAIAARQTS